MKSHLESRLLVRPFSDSGEFVWITPSTAGWEHLYFGARRMQEDESWESKTGDLEFGLVILAGACSIRSSNGEWLKIGRRRTVFDGMPYALYLPRNTEFKVTAHTDNFLLAYGACKCEVDHVPKLVTPEDVAVEFRGGGSASRQINSLFPPGFNCHRLVAVEVYTPAGNWSSYPPHKHDVHRVDADGKIIEADLEEIYFYQFDRPEGYAIQRIYTSDRRVNETITAESGDVVLVPEGYHPVAAAHGYNAYYLNFLAGSAQSLANSDDPDHIWIKENWPSKDPRVPVVTLEMEK
ncbi:MAG: 5-deoxy-glucuronate isomerase [Verrucomicrobia bacterium]|nr:5-deoxy-glucuronate isomerase [Verrucomicrobiota bacterium]